MDGDFSHPFGRSFNSSDEDGDNAGEEDCSSFSSVLVPRPTSATPLFQHPTSGSSSPKKDGRSLPEFVGGCGSQGIFKPPVRAAMDPRRPPSLELRPNPLRETQIGCFLRTIAGTERQLWAGAECGLRFWNFDDMFRPGACPDLIGDWDTAPFRKSHRTSPAVCLVVDSANDLVWSGHKDGTIRLWKVDESLDGDDSFREALAWKAHTGPTLSIIISTYGDMWSVSEGGVIKVWPWESLEKSFSLMLEERHMASLYLEKSFIDLRNELNIVGTYSYPAGDTRYLLSDNSNARVWSGSYLSFGLWDARSKELLKVFNIDGQVENCIDTSFAQDFCLEEKVGIKIFSGLKKEKPQGSISFFQRSRNVLMGAADAVRRVAAKGAFGDDNRTEAMILSTDGMIWTGCSNGLIVQWDGSGKRLQEFRHHYASVQCFCSFGTRLWVGYMSGIVQVLDLEGNLCGEWTAHSSPVIKMAVGAGYIFSLANHGGIRGWSILSPGPLDNILRSELSNKQHIYTQLENLKILTGTWNVGQERASPGSLISWLGSVASDVDIVVTGLQEVEMGAGFLAMAAAKETVGLEGSANGQWWLDAIGRIMDGVATFEHIGSRQLAGLLISVWARRNLRLHIGNIDVAAVPCGFGRAIGNKGAVGLRMRIYDRVICFVNCHFAAHQDAVNNRNADFDHIYQSMIFNRPSGLLSSAAASASYAVYMLRNESTLGVYSLERRPQLAEADMVVFFGDLNYRLDDITYDEARDIVSQGCFDYLQEKDQLRAEMKGGRVFQGMREGLIKFPPTYKFEKHIAGCEGYDSSDKKRIPAWCDRILYRDDRSAAMDECSLDCPVVASILQYDACMDVTDSDHKPVRCIFRVDIAHVDESVRRREFGKIIKSNDKIKYLVKELCSVPDSSVSVNGLVLQNKTAATFQITNHCRKEKAIYEIRCEGQSTVKDTVASQHHVAIGDFGFPRWIEVTPATGVIKPGGVVNITVRHEESHTVEEFVDGILQKSWQEDARDKGFVLAVKIRGCFSVYSRTQRILVNHSASSLSTTSSPSPCPEKTSVSLLDGFDFTNTSSPSDGIGDLIDLHSP